MEPILKYAGYERDFIFPHYVKYSNGRNSFYVFLIEDEEVAVSFDDKEIYTTYRLVKKLNVPAKIYDLSLTEERPYNLSNSSLSDLYLNLFELEPFEDDIFLTKNGNKAVLLFYDFKVSGYAYVDDDANTNFVTKDFGFWSEPKEKFNRDRPILYTSKLDKIRINWGEHNIIVGKSNYLYINQVIAKFGYSNIVFDDDLNWFLGNIVNINNNTPYSLQLYEKGKNLVIFSNKPIKCLNLKLEYSYPFENRYMIKNDENLFKEVINEINQSFNLPVNSKY